MNWTVAPFSPTRWLGAGRDLLFSQLLSRSSDQEPQISWDRIGLSSILNTVNNHESAKVTLWDSQNGHNVRLPL